MTATIALTERFIEGLEKYNLTLEEIQSGKWKYCGGNRGTRHSNYFKLFFGDNDYPDHSDYCVCGHFITENCYICDPDHNILILGNCCIKKFLPESGRTCSICSEPHKNRKDNKCNKCRKSNLNTGMIRLDKGMEKNKEFIINGDTKIGFGKLIGHPHSAFLSPVNEKYKNWIINQGPEFRYKNTRDWILKQSEGKEPVKILITSDRNPSVQSWNELRNKLNEILSDHPEFNLVLEFNV